MIKTSISTTVGKFQMSMWKYFFRIDKCADQKHHAGGIFSSIFINVVLGSVRPKSPFWFKLHTETQTQNLALTCDRYRNCKILNWKVLYFSYHVNYQNFIEGLILFF